MDVVLTLLTAFPKVGVTAVTALPVVAFTLSTTLVKPAVTPVTQVLAVARGTAKAETVMVLAERIILCVGLQTSPVATLVFKSRRPTLSM
ncbi:hypothetical protein GCM10007874_14810 [Labrys miyagiensis]|uniref:Secreted protein n=1 Tax=Labrys miyagiensis TaxID=346912 RepID=A0ABQ6CIC8_9HYPH|nr:hypothetical protein GCM10007874_14810 [Labrys miyagiensis]